MGFINLNDVKLRDILDRVRGMISNHVVVWGYDQVEEGRVC